MNAPQHVAVAAIDMSSGEKAADGISDAIFSSLHAVEHRLTSEHGAESAMEFYAVLMARMAGFLSGTMGPENAGLLIEMTRCALQQSEPKIAHELATRRAKAH